MGWARFDDRWPTHPKLLAAGLEAKGLDASGICYAAGQETDGFIPDSALLIIAAGHRNPRKVAAVLVGVGRWSRDDERKGYIIHDYLEYNPTRESREADRVEKRRAGKLGGQRSGETRRGSKNEANTKQSASSRTEAECFKQNGSTQVQAEPKHAVELPSRPVPSPSSSSSLKHQAGAPEPDDDDDEKFRASKARSIVAERRIDALTTPPANRRAYRSQVLRDVGDEHGDELARLAGNGLSAEAIADVLEPVPKPYPTYPEAGTIAEQVWDETTDEDGNLVVMPRRVG